MKICQNFLFGIRRRHVCRLRQLQKDLAAAELRAIKFMFVLLELIFDLSWRDRLSHVNLPGQRQT